MSGGEKILILEDEKTLGEILVNKLMQEGYHAEWTLDGESGLKKMREWMPDLVLLDIVMPKKDGYEVLEEMSQDDALKKIPVIVISNSGQPVEIERILALGAKDYLVKAQFSPEEVLAKMTKYLSSRSGAPKEAKDKTGLSILIVEDDPFLSSLAHDHLQKEGYTVRVVPDGSQALAALEREMPSLVLLDLIMPEMGGFEALKKMRENPKTKDVPVIIFSNLGQEQDIEEARRLGARDFLVKAKFTLSEVSEKIEAILGTPKKS